MMNSLRTFRPVLTTLIFLFISISFYAQDQFPGDDSLRQYTIGEVVITANRYENKILNSGSAVSSMDKNELQTLPAGTFSEALMYLPGVYMASSDGMGLDPQISLRGFYGGGEAEYLKVLIDGIPVNNLENGLVSWNMLPLGQINRVELLRGGSSPLYGDAAMGGVINLRTDRDLTDFTNASIGYGAFNTYNIGAAHGGRVGSGTYELYAANNSTDGFREHSKWSSINFGGKANIPLSRNSFLTLSTFNQILSSEDPGFWSDTLLVVDRDESLPYFREDGKDFQKFLVNLGFNTAVNPNTNLSLDLSYQHNNREITRTFAQYPIILIPAGEFQYYQSGVNTDTTIFGDTKKREINTDQLSFAVRTLTDIPEIGARITGGIEAEYGGFDNTYYDVFRGFEVDYANNFMPWDSIDTQGDGFRFTSAAYLSGEVRLLDPLKLLAGVRYDFISDEFNGQVPDTSIAKTNSAFSPKLALNLTTGDSEDYSGSIYASVSRSFKAPTIDQRTDLKHLYYYAFLNVGPTYIPFEIKADPFSNADLKPQFSTSYEIGTYQMYRFSENLTGELSMSGYLIQVEDEIDFDLMTQKYRNIVNTEHTGLETFLRLNYKKLANAFFTYSYSQVTFSDGELEGKNLKGIPANTYSGGINVIPEKGIGGSVLFSGASGIYLDDENTQKLDAYGVINARVTYSFAFATIYLDVNNVFNNHYNSTGYLLDGIRYLYPAVGRFIKGGVNFHF